MTFLGLDINGTRVRAVQGPAADFPLPLSLDPPAIDLPLMLSLENGSPEVGLAGLRQCRRRPYLVCHGFLPHLADVSDSHRRFWRGGRHRLDAGQAMAAVWKRLQPLCRRAKGVVLGLPGYLSHTQTAVILNLAAKLRLPITSSLTSPFAAALAGYADQIWDREALVVDIDDHAMSLVAVRAVDGKAHVVESRHLPHLGLRLWRERILNSLAEQCVLNSRRDPRGSPLAEQCLFDQIDGLLDACYRGSMIQLSVQSSSWYQNLVVQPEQTVAVCTELTLQALYEIEAMWVGVRNAQRESPDADPSSGEGSALLVTHAVSRLPGFVTALRTFVDSDGSNPASSGQKSPSRPGTCLRPGTWLRPGTSLGKDSWGSDGEDFGEGLLAEPQSEPIPVAILSIDGPSRALHGLAASGIKGHQELAAPLPRPAAVEAGPPRLHFQGHDYLLGEHNFYVGCNDGRHLAVHDTRHGGNDGSHCEIIFDHRAYILYNRSRDATLVNEFPVSDSTILRPGDWIRLGHEGPLVRFLGQLQPGRAPMRA